MIKGIILTIMFALRLTNSNVEFESKEMLGLVFLILSPGIIIGLVIGCLSKEKTEEA